MYVIWYILSVFIWTKNSLINLYYLESSYQLVFAYKIHLWQQRYHKEVYKAKFGILIVQRYRRMLAVMTNFLKVKTTARRQTKLLNFDKLKTNMLYSKQTLIGGKNIKIRGRRVCCSVLYKLMKAVNLFLKQLIFAYLCCYFDRWARGSVGLHQTPECPVVPEDTALQSHGHSLCSLHHSGIPVASI